jgi:hypothetical protein
MKIFKDLRSAAKYFKGIRANRKQIRHAPECKSRSRRPIRTPEEIQEITDRALMILHERLKSSGLLVDTRER